MGIELVGTRVAGVSQTSSLLDRVADLERGDIAIASAYWDDASCATAIDLARRIGGVARVVLWTAGATKSAWRAACDAVGSTDLDLRFIDAPDGGGIFHAKVAAVVDRSGTWRCALVGSANLTTAGRVRNVELGVLVHDEPVPLAQLRTWFDELWDAAEPAIDFAWDRAIAIAPERSEAAARKQLFGAEGLANPAPAPAPAAAPASRSGASLAATPTTLAACHGRREAIDGVLERLTERLTRTTDGSSRGERGWRFLPGREHLATVRKLRVGYHPEDATVRLCACPGDTLGQARELYAKPERVERVLALVADGWSIRPNFHWGFVETGYAWSTPTELTLGLEAYARYWVDRLAAGDLGQVRQSQWTSEWARLVADRIVSAEDWGAFAREFVDTERTTADPRPGLRCEFAWTLDDAIALERAGELDSATRARADELLDVLGEPLLPRG